MAAPNKDLKYPLHDYKKLCFLKNVISSANVFVGDYTYYDDFEDVKNFERNIKYHFDFTGDALRIGKFCMLASGVSFIMNGGNHLTSAISSYPFAIFGEDWKTAMDGKSYPNKGDTTIGNDVWLGHKAVIMSGVTIGDGAIVAAHSVVVTDIPPYTVYGGNPAKLIKKRFEDDQIELLLAQKWWDWPIDKITKHVKSLTSGQFDFLHEES